MSFNNSDFGKFSHVYALPGISMENAKSFIEQVEREAKKWNAFIVEGYVENTLTDEIVNFGILYKGTTIQEVEDYLEEQLSTKHIDEDMLYYFDVYQFNAPNEPEIVENYVMNNIRLYKCIAEYEVEVDIENE